MGLTEFEKTTRAKRGLHMLRELKSKPHRIVGFFTANENDSISIQTANGVTHSIYPLELSMSDRVSNGSFVIDTDHDGEVTEAWKETTYEKPFEAEEEKE